ncbi:hypothetical protein E3N88_16792 [Mikania micrantha]|uniref:Uncharacterized protein n=1 Tax=Mikania micrantha TaxID=192012 RepID=A0A5N6NQ09_9ASTR|nr:hypothetical protein E3N88_16792 [Mikania micrantha]
MFSRLRTSGGVGLKYWLAIGLPFPGWVSNGLEPRWCVNIWLPYAFCHGGKAMVFWLLEGIFGQMAPPPTNGAVLWVWKK